MTTYREGCGTYLGMRLHRATGEQPCGECVHGERVRALELERHAPLPEADPHATLNGPTAAYAEVERQRRLWETANEIHNAIHRSRMTPASAALTMPPTTAPRSA